VGKVSFQGALRDYGVVLSGTEDAPVVDETATGAQRSRRREQRTGDEPFFDGGPGYARLAEGRTAGRRGLGPMTPRSGPLSGIVVVDLTRALAGPQAGMMLADLGARVIKVETPVTGDDIRGWGPPLVKPGGSSDPEDQVSTYFLSCNRNKESIALDLKSDDGRATLEALVGRSDVLLETFRTGVLDRLGFSMERLLELSSRSGCCGSGRCRRALRGPTRIGSSGSPTGFPRRWKSRCAS